MKKHSVFIVIITMACFVSAAFAQAPQKVNFQGKLTNAAGISVNGSVSMVFRIYDVASGGTALWTETQSVTITNGIYNVLLGKNNPIDTELTETKPLWLGVKVGADAEMSPRVELTPGVYDVIILNTITVKDGNIGLGRTPIEKLDVDGNIMLRDYANVSGAGRHIHFTSYGWGSPGPKIRSAMDFAAGEASRAKLILSSYWEGYKDEITLKNGSVGINTSDPESNFHVNVRSSSSPIGAMTVDVRSFITAENARQSYYFRARDAAINKTVFMIRGDGRVGIGTTNPSYTLDVNGTLRASGSDLAEPFDMTDIATLELGDVVVMDPDNPKHLTKSLTAYDHKVAGIVSSSEQAGYVAGSRSDGSSDKPVALTGRVLCKVSAENGAIEVGDLLTTSNTPGYAMKATDRDKAFGAVLGKALEAFDGDKGQILVLVALQ